MGTMLATSPLMRDPVESGSGTFASLDPGAAAADAISRKQPHMAQIKCMAHLRFHPAIEVISHSFGYK
jgi:hypothetical protein